MAGRPIVLQITLSLIKRSLSMPVLSLLFLDGTVLESV